MAAFHTQNPPSLNLALIVVPNDAQAQDKLEEGLTVETVDVSVDLQTGLSSTALVAVTTHPDTMFETTNLCANMQTTHVAVTTDEDATMMNNVVVMTDEEARIPFADLLAWWRTKIDGKPAPGWHFVALAFRESRTELEQSDAIFVEHSLERSFICIVKSRAASSLKDLFTFTYSTISET
ncbi:hypothetical protein C8R45DRAFT_948191 [Mycena sanguinolenta]|nr:hypothetical protein C8R45DRAFT_948191 [Mycena sanguinolenta]